MYIWDGSEDLSAEVIDDDFIVKGEVKSLKGCPKEVTGNFDCSNNKHITTLEGAPEKVGGDFVCSYCDKLISLKGSPKETGDFLCNYCNSLKSLKGCPEKVNSFFAKKCPELKVIDDVPKEFLVLILFSPIEDFDVSIIEKIDTDKLGSIYVDYSSDGGYISLSPILRDKIIMLKRLYENEKISIEKLKRLKDKIDDRVLTSLKKIFFM